jgi:dTDP-4-dehydrorhamnose reductase
MKLLVTGASGLLGLNLSLKAFSLGYEVKGLVHSHELHNTPFLIERVDLTRCDFEELLLDYNPALIINCSALADIDMAEANPETAYQINKNAPGQMSLMALRHNIKFIHISTDAVFDGTSGNYVEEDLPNPLNIYAQSKLEGEKLVIYNNPQAIVARVNFYGWSLSGKRSLAEFFFNNLSQGNTINGFNDVFFCPLYVGHLSEILLEMARLKLYGLFHVVSRESLSKYKFGLMIADRFGFDPGIIKSNSIETAGLKATRSSRLTLSVDKVEKELDIRMPNQEEGMDYFYRDFLSGWREKLKACM